jgi:hypothetical protein
MSYTTIIHVYPNEKIECGDELRNSWGSAPYVWDYLIKKYIDPSANMMRYENLDPLWKLWKRKDIPIFERSVLMLTFDRCYIAKTNYARAAADIRQFLAEHNDIGIINHWHRIAEIFESNPDVPGIGLWCTSVSENPFDGPWDEEKESYDDPDWNDVDEIYEQINNFSE